MKLLDRWFALVIVGQLTIGCGSREPSPPPAAAHADSGTVEVAGVAIPYVTEGTGLLCIAYGCQQLNRRLFSRRFKAALRCVYLDHRGFVPSAPVVPNDPFGVAAAVADLETAREQLALDRFVLVGHSIN